jgi:hypothetical protein
MPFAYDVALADLTGNGWLDVAVSGWKGNQIAWFENPGNADGSWNKHLLDGERARSAWPIWTVMEIPIFWPQVPEPNSSPGTSILAIPRPATGGSMSSTQEASDRCRVILWTWTAMGGSMW